MPAMLEVWFQGKTQCIVERRVGCSGEVHTAGLSVPLKALTIRHPLYTRDRGL